MSKVTKVWMKLLMSLAQVENLFRVLNTLLIEVRSDEVGAEVDDLELDEEVEVVSLRRKVLKALKVTNLRKKLIVMWLPLKVTKLKTTTTSDEAVDEVGVEEAEDDEAADEVKTLETPNKEIATTLKLLTPILMKIMLLPTKKVPEPQKVLLEAEDEAEVEAEEEGVEAEADEVGEDEVNRVKMLPPLLQKSLLSKRKIKLNSKIY